MKLNMSSLATNFLTAALACSVLVSCGTAFAKVQTPKLQVESTIVSNVPVPNYTDSEELAAFNLFNAERQNCGFGLVEQNEKLDKSAKGHADWLLANNVQGHFQKPGTQFFSGIDHTERAIATEYSKGDNFSAGEVMFDLERPKYGQGVSGVRTILNAPYHALIAMLGHRHIGISVRDKNDIGLFSKNRSIVNINFGYGLKIGTQAPASHGIRTYPCNGSTGINPLMDGETPSPVPGRDFNSQPLGSTIIIVGDVGTKIVITRAVMENALNGEIVKLRTPVTKVTDSNPDLLDTNEAYVSPDAPLKGLTPYKVEITGVSGGKPFTTSFTFTPGKAEPR